MTIRTIPTTWMESGTSSSASAATAVAKSGVVAMSGLVREAPSRFWLMLSSVQPAMKWIRPAMEKFAIADADSCRTAPASSSSRTITMKAEHTRSWRNVDA